MARVPGLLQYGLYAYMSHMVFFVVTQFISTYSKSSIRHLSLANMALHCTTQETVKLYPMQCAEIIRHPPACFLVMWISDAMANFSVCGYSRCEDALSFRTLLAMVLVFLVMRSPVAAKRVYGKYKKIARG